MNHDLFQTGAFRRQFLPEPDRQILEGRVLEAFDLVQIVVIEDLEEGPDGAGDVAKIANPATLGADRAREMHRDLERMPVQAVTFVVGRHIRQPVGGFERELLEDLHDETLTSGPAPVD